MYAYRGQEDPLRVCPDELGEEELHRQLTILTGLEASIISMEVKVEPFSQGAPPREVSVFHHNFL